MYDPTLYPRVLSTLAPEDFFYPENAEVFRAMGELFTAKLDINVKSVWNHLYRKKANVGLTESELLDMLTYRVDGEACMSFAIQLAEFSGYRVLERGVDKLSRSLARREGNLEYYSSQLAALVRTVSSKDVHGEFSTGDTLTASYYEMLNREKNTLKYTGIEAIDARLVDFDAKEISYLAARPGTGKSAMMLQSARVNLEQGARVGFLSMEMSVAKLMNRLVSSKAMFNGEHLLSMTGEELHKNDALREAVEWYSKQPLYIDDAGPFTREGVLQKIRKLVYDYGCDVVYIDYIGLIQIGGSGSRNDQLSTMSRELKGVAMELDIPLVIASQLSRDVVKRGNARPNLADLRDSGSLEQDGSIVAFLYPDVAALATLDMPDIDTYLKEQEDVMVKFEVQKQRNGPVFTRNLVFHKPYGRFVLREEELATY